MTPNMASRRRTSLGRRSSPTYPLPGVGADTEQAKNEALLRSLADQCTDAVFGTVAQAVEELGTPRIKPTRPYKTYDGPLNLGDPEKYDSALSISIERYFMTKVARQAAGSTVVLKPETGGPSQSTQTLDGDVEMGSGDFSAVKTQRTYKVEDPDALGGKIDVSPDDLARGYEYGRTAVAISESEHNITQLETTKDFAIIGFVPFDKVSIFAPL